MWKMIPQEMPKTGARKDFGGQSNFGLVFQDFNLFPAFFRVEKVMDAPVKNQKRPKQEVEKEARALLAKMGLEGKEDAYPCELSGGQKQRVRLREHLHCVRKCCILMSRQVHLTRRLPQRFYVY